MKNTGIIRKLDELGRIVIPKELRKRYKIEIGDFIDISTSSDTIVLKKYDPLDAEESNLNKLVTSIKEEYNCDILISSKEKIIVSTIKNVVVNGSISDSIIKLMNQKEETEILKPDNFEISNDYITKNTLFIKKVTQNSDIYGYIIIISSNIISKSEKDLTNILKRYILNNIVK